jgi:hypothetical protein
MCYGIYGLCVFNATLNISFNSESESEYGITLNRHNYEVKVSGVCLFVRPYVVTLSQFRIIKYHRMPSLQILSSGVLKKCCLYFSRAIWNTEWLPMTSDWSKYFPLLLLHDYRWSHETCQKRSSILCVTWTIFLKYGAYFSYAHSFPFSIENQIIYSIKVNGPYLYILAWNLNKYTSLVFIRRCNIKWPSPVFLMRL